MSLEMQVGELKGAMKSTEEKVERLEERMERVENKQDQILDIISQTRGGWKVLSVLAAVAATVGAAMSKLVPKFLFFLFG